MDMLKKARVKAIAAAKEIQTIVQSPPSASYQQQNQNYGTYGQTQYTPTGQLSYPQQQTPQPYQPQGYAPQAPNQYVGLGSSHYPQYATQSRPQQQQSNQPQYGVQQVQQTTTYGHVPQGQQTTYGQSVQGHQPAYSPPPSTPYQSPAPSYPQYAPPAQASQYGQQQYPATTETQQQVYQSQPLPQTQNQPYQSTIPQQQPIYQPPISPPPANYGSTPQYGQHPTTSPPPSHVQAYGGPVQSSQLPPTSTYGSPVQPNQNATASPPPYTQGQSYEASFMTSQQPNVSLPYHAPQSIHSSIQPTSSPGPYPTSTHGSLMQPNQPSASLPSPSQPNNDSNIQQAAQSINIPFVPHSPRPLARTSVSYHSAGPQPYQEAAPPQLPIRTTVQTGAVHSPTGPEARRPTPPIAVQSPVSYQPSVETGKDNHKPTSPLPQNHVWPATFQYTPSTQPASSIPTQQAQAQPIKQPEPQHVVPPQAPHTFQYPYQKQSPPTLVSPFSTPPPTHPIAPLPPYPESRASSVKGDDRPRYSSPAPAHPITPQPPYPETDAVSMTEQSQHNYPSPVSAHPVAPLPPYPESQVTSLPDGNKIRILSPPPVHAIAPLPLFQQPQPSPPPLDYQSQYAPPPLKIHRPSLQLESRSSYQSQHSAPAPENNQTQYSTPPLPANEPPLDVYELSQSPASKHPASPPIPQSKPVTAKPPIHPEIHREDSGLIAVEFENQSYEPVYQIKSPTPLAIRKRQTKCIGFEPALTDIVEFFELKPSVAKAHNLSSSIGGGCLAICEYCFYNIIAPHEWFAKCFDPRPKANPPADRAYPQISFEKLVGCGMAFPAIRQIVLNQTIPQNSIQPFIEYARLDATLGPCTGQPKTGGYYGTRTVEDMAICNSCFECYIRGTAFERHFSLMQMPQPNQQWVCDVGYTGYIHRTLVADLSKPTPDFGHFAYEARKRLQMPPCAGESKPIALAGPDRTSCFRSVRDNCGVFCSSCFYDCIAGIPGCENFGFEIQIDDEGQKATIACDLALGVSKYFMELAVKAGRYDVWHVPILAKGQQPPCSSTKGVDEADLMHLNPPRLWYHFKDHPEIEVCPRCYGMTICSLQAEELFTPITRPLRPGRIRLCHLTPVAQPSYSFDPKSYPNTLLWRSSYLHNTLTYSHASDSYGAVNHAARHIASLPPVAL